MSCAACLAFDSAERAAIAERELPTHSLDACTCDEENPLDVLFVPPWRFRGRPQAGLALHMTWGDLARWLALPTMGEAKDEAGAWSPALYREGVRRKAALVHAHAIVVDVDQGGDVERVASVVARYRAIVHSTFSSTPEVPRCRIVLALAVAIDAPTYEAVHAVIRAHLQAVDIAADEGAKDASRVSYAPVVRPGAEYRFAATHGAPLDAGVVLDAQPPPAPRSAPRPLNPKHAGAYVRGALRRAAGAVAGAIPGARHAALNREAHALARLALDEAAIVSALLPAFVAAAGERREHEGRRTIRDAVQARRS
jgi:hypothetical protein